MGKREFADADRWAVHVALDRWLGLRTTPAQYEALDQAWAAHPPRLDVDPQIFRSDKTGAQ